MRYKRYFLVVSLGVLQFFFVLLVSSTVALQCNSRYDSLSGILILDLYTNRGGMGANAFGGIFHSGDLIVLYANVTYSGSGIAGILVSYEVRNSLGYAIVCSTAITDSQGIGKISFIIPSAPVDEIFGSWTTVATASVAQISANDRLSFQVTENQSSIPGDVNDDGIVDIGDSTLVSIWWNMQSPPAPANVDIDGDGIVSISDAAIIGSNWQRHG